VASSRCASKRCLNVCSRIGRGAAVWPITRFVSKRAAALASWTPQRLVRCGELGPLSGSESFPSLVALLASTW
jgi:hypothetical protein